MENSEESKGFNVLVALCAGPDRRDQESYLARVIRKSIRERRDRNISDGELLNELGVSKDNFDVVMKVFDAIYARAACLLLESPSRDLLHVRLEAIKKMLSTLAWRHETRRIEEHRIAKGFCEECEDKELSK